MRLNGTRHVLYSALYCAERQRVGRNPDPSAAIVYSQRSQRVKAVEESTRIRGYDAHKCVTGRKRHRLVDTLGLPLSIYSTLADIHDIKDTAGARRLLGGLGLFVPELKKICADADYHGQELDEWRRECQQRGDGWELEVMEREPGRRGFGIQPCRWVVEKRFA